MVRQISDGETVATAKLTPQSDIPTTTDLCVMGILLTSGLILLVSVLIYAIINFLSWPIGALVFGLALVFASVLYVQIREAMK